jgi:eukaryotic-like serine/threonine-protein kinase
MTSEEPTVTSGGAAPPGPPPASAPTRSPYPDRIGPYRITRVLGQGGMGTVYEAEQLEPLRRTVALKVIRRGMDTDEVLARFESERQALAVMDHPNIARALEAGTTDEGLP